MDGIQQSENLKNNTTNVNPKLRNVETCDINDLFKWRNHPDIRKNFFNENTILWDTHEKWFRKRIEDTNTTIYIACCNEQKIGSMRFEDKGDAIKVSVMPNPGFLGKGVGSKIIKLGTERFVKEKHPDKPICAEIKKDNVVSIKAFQRAGFQESYSVFVYSK